MSRVSLKVFRLCLQIIATYVLVSFFTVDCVQAWNTVPMSSKPISTLTTYQGYPEDAADLAEKVKGFKQPAQEDTSEPKESWYKASERKPRLIKRGFLIGTIVVLLLCAIFPQKVNVLVGIDALTFALYFVYGVFIVVNAYVHIRSKPYRKTVSLRTFIDMAEGGTFLEDEILAARIRGFKNTVIFVKSVIPIFFFMMAIALHVTDIPILREQMPTVIVIMLMCTVFVSAFFVMLTRDWRDTVKDFKLKEEYNPVAFSFDSRGDVILWYDRHYVAFMKLFAWFLPPVYSYMHNFEPMEYSAADYFLHPPSDVRYSPSVDATITKKNEAETLHLFEKRTRKSARDISSASGIYRAA